MRSPIKSHHQLFIWSPDLFQRSEDPSAISLHLATIDSVEIYRILVKRFGIQRASLIIALVAVQVAGCCQWPACGARSRRAPRVLWEERLRKGMLLM